MRGYRLKQIEQYVLDNDTVSLEALCKKFGVSMNTVRRDIAELLKMGSIEKIYGGVRAKRQNPLVPFEVRHDSHGDLKAQVGRKAAEFIQDGDIIYIDSGTTTPKLFENLPEGINLTLITGSLSVIVEAVPFPNINVIATAGQLDRKTRSFVGANTIDALERYNIKKAFMAATGISLSSGVTNSSLLELETKRKAVQKAEEIYLLVDSTKFGVAALTTYAQISDITHVVTDTLPAPEYLQAFQQYGVEVVCCGGVAGE